ncbi:MAG TPA: alpha/beta hydrolase [Myxococcota bacterium]|nr:alpha/beta hydrolase [Myxococcota bacterium]
MPSGPHEIKIDAGGMQFRALEWPGAGPPVLLLHATSFCADVWGPAWLSACAAGAAGRRALAADARGHGGTSAPREAREYAWPRLADDAVALVEACAELEGAILVGHSSGGAAALVAAARRPELVRGVVAIEPVLFDPPAAGAELDSFAGSRGMAERARRRRASFKSREDARQTLVARFPYSGFAPAALDAFVAGGLAAREGGVELRCSPEVEAWIYEGASALDLWREAGEISVPVLLLRAEQSAIPEALALRLASRARRLEIQQVAAATHFAPLEQPEQVGRAIGQFVSTIADGAA